ncbi:MAG: AAA family ATPase [Elusimicrobia bacterium]|nr:AAA family ATPase [Elusimicrobiota bacterium]
MFLKSLEFSQFIGKPAEWSLEKLMLNKINLIVGKNATGKTKTLNVINNLSRLITGEIKPTYDSANFKLIYDKDRKNIEYTLIIENKKVNTEKLRIDSRLLLNREEKGESKIFAEQLHKFMKFQAPTNELACVVRRDTLQHPFFDDIYQWGKTTFHYLFGTQLGKDIFDASLKDENIKAEINLKDTHRVVSIFKQGLGKYRDKYKKSIVNDMNEIGYKIDDIKVNQINSIKLQGAGLIGLIVKESDISVDTEQNQISQGMFRALSLLIQLNYSKLETKPSCILIDDIGEGLDYERASTLIKILIDKAKSSSVQLIMSTNDRFVMNNVPLKYWCLIQRKGQLCKVYNYQNSKKIFDEFSYTGLNNFDFLSTEFYSKGSNKK